MEINPSTSPLPSTSSEPSTSAASETPNADVAESPIRVLRLIRLTPETLIRGTQTTTPSESNTSNVEQDVVSNELETTETTPPENPRKVIFYYI